jgi:adenosylhomocysteine nucleosidase
MIAIVFALEFEGAVFAAKQDRQLRVATWLLGAMGAGTAEVLAKKLAQTKPRLVISAGFGGGLQPGISVGDLVLGLNYSDPTVASQLVLSDRWHRGNLFTAEAIVEKSEGKRKLGEETGCLVADLETAHLAKICAEHHIPMLSVRCISDALEDDMPVPANVLLHPETGRPDSLGLFRHLITNPTSVGGFNRLLKNAKTAQNGISDGLTEVIPQLLRLI